MIGHSSSVMRHSLLPWVIMLIALVVGVSGINVVPPNAHEVFVLRTAQEMHDRGDWIVPYYQGRLRLEKPPLNYWLTGFAAWISGESDHVQPWHGRVASVLGGLLLVGCTLVMGRRLFDEASANLGGLIAATSLGLVTYTHSARPELMYAGWCAVVMLGLVMGYVEPPRSGGRPPSGACKILWFAVICVGGVMATLAKGPHVPGMIVGGFAVWAVLNCEHRWRAVGRGLMWLVIGAVIVALGAGWWWWLMKHRLGEQQLANSALGGGGYEFLWSRVVRPDYLVFLMKLMATWAMLIPAGIALLMHRKGRGANSAHLIGWWLLVALAAFWGAAHRRDYYMLPYVGVMGLLLGAGTWRFVRIWHRQKWLRIGGTIYTAGLVVVIVVGNSFGAFWSNQRQQMVDFGRQIAAGTPSDQRLAGVGTQADVVGYVAERHVAYCPDAAALRKLVREQGVRTVSAVMPERFVADFADWSPQQLGQVVDEDSGKAVVWVRLTVPADSQP